LAECSDYKLAAQEDSRPKTKKCTQLTNNKMYTVQCNAVAYKQANYIRHKYKKITDWRYHGIAPNPITIVVQ